MIIGIVDIVEIVSLKERKWCGDKLCSRRIERQDVLNAGNSLCSMNLNVHLVVNYVISVTK